MDSFYLQKHYDVFFQYGQYLNFPAFLILFFHTYTFFFPFTKIAMHDSHVSSPLHWQTQSSREITQMLHLTGILKFQYSFAIFIKGTRVRCLFLFCVLIIVFQGFYICILNRKYPPENILLWKWEFLPIWIYGESPCPVKAGSRKISKCLLVAISNVTTKLNNAET